MHKRQPQAPSAEASSKSERSAADRAAPMGMGAADTEGRLAASVGQLESVAPCFAPALDVPNGGVLCALPALLAIGLLEGVERHLQLPKGYYGLDSLLLLMAFMALARLPSIEALRYCAPGEWGNLLGLDRVPEVRTLRAKIHLLAEDNQPAAWSAALCERWMAAAPEQAGVLYIDGHVRSITAARRNCRVITSPANGCVCAPPPTTGSTPWMDSRSSSSTKWSIRD
ncbi:MAG: hypothetical protein QNM00_03725 [Gammaproteobacteria bacterium]|nr:hypothetical protein [Gammaproteobacteria bacterium]